MPATPTGVSPLLPSVASEILKCMIARRWKVWTPRDKSDDLKSYLQRTGVSEALEAPDNGGTLLLRSGAGDDCVEFILLTFWNDWDAIADFAGSGVRKAVLYPEDRAYFTGGDEEVEHMTMVSWSDTAANNPRSGKCVVGGDLLDEGGQAGFIEQVGGADGQVMPDIVERGPDPLDGDAGERGPGEPVGG
jgi:hypothetical protein